MDALELLLNRTSQPRLTDPAPQGQALENIMAAALRAPDHAGLTPWRFILCKGKGRERLGAIYQQAAIRANKGEADITRAPQLPLRAPLVVVAIAEYSEHPKVPRIEQIQSTGCAVQAMQMAALAQGFGGVWRTGAYAKDPYVRDQLGLKEQDEIVAFLYLGTPALTAPPRPGKDTDDFFRVWD